MVSLADGNQKTLYESTGFYISKKSLSQKEIVSNTKETIKRVEKVLETLLKDRLIVRKGSVVKIILNFNY